MPKVVPFPIPYDSVAEYRCPHGHKAGWKILAVQHEGGSAFLNIICRSKGCDFATIGTFTKGEESEEIQTGE